jgi:TRAP-type C4-dicarboxylate transport system permease small subunit
MVDPRVRVVAIIATGLLLLFVLELWSDALEQISGALGIASPPNALFVVAFGFVLLLLLNFSVAVSRLTDQSKILAQRIALLEERLRRVEEGSAQGAYWGEDVTRTTGEERAPAAISRSSAKR